MSTSSEKRRIEEKLDLGKWRYNLRIALTATSDEACMILGSDITDKILNSGLSKQAIIEALDSPEYKAMNDKCGHLFDDVSVDGQTSEDRVKHIRSVGSCEAHTLSKQFMS